MDTKRLFQREGDGGRLGPLASASSAWRHLTPGSPGSSWGRPRQSHGSVSLDVAWGMTKKAWRAAGCSMKLTSMKLS